MLLRTEGFRLQIALPIRSISAILVSSKVLSSPNAQAKL